MAERSEPVEVIAVTRAGAVLAARLSAALPEARAFVPSRFVAAAGPEATGYEGPVTTVVREAFARCNGLVLVMAAGAAVRLVAPHLRHKTLDPAVVVVDDGGRFAIALLSGHVGGANALTDQVAAILGAQPVITTASEARGVPSPDLIGRSLGWQVENPDQLKPLAAALVNGEPVGLLHEAGERTWHDGPLPPTIDSYDSVEALVAAAPAGAILISDRLLPAATRRPGWVVYRPPTLVLGVGCSRGASEAEIEALVTATLATHGLSPLSLRAVATLDRKADEPGLRAFAERRRLPLCSYPAAALDAVAGQEHPSETVRTAVGTRGVCEPAALLCAGASRLLVPKQKSHTVTVAVARADLTRVADAPSPPSLKGRGRALGSASAKVLPLPCREGGRGVR